MMPPDKPTFLDGMNDALAASAVVAAILAAFFTLWQGEIQEALDREADPGAGNWEITAGPIRKALWGRAVPLFAIAMATLAVLIPRTCGIFKHVRLCWRETTCAYDDVQALFVLTALLILGIAILAVMQIWRLAHRLITKA
jgi:hypothetical protein